MKKETVGSRLGARTDGRAESLKKLMPRENTGRAEKEKQKNEETKREKDRGGKTWVFMKNYRNED